MSILTARIKISLDTSTVFLKFETNPKQILIFPVSRTTLVCLKISKLIIVTQSQVIHQNAAIEPGFSEDLSKFPAMSRAAYK